MQVSERLAFTGQQWVNGLRSLPLKSVHNLLCGLLVLWLLIVIAQFIWALMPSEVDTPAAANVALMPQVSTKEVDIAKLQKHHLFGEAGAVAPKQPVAATIEDDVALNATKTQLNLSLEGVVHTPDAADSVAIIVYQGKQDQYLVGDSLPVSSKVTLARVLLDHVILDNAGRYESLWLYDDEKKSAATTTRNQRIAVTKRNNVTDKRNNDRVTDLASGYREKLYNNPSSLAQVLRISPAQKGGTLIGYRVSPSRDKEQFAALGFKANDVVTSVNGIELNDPTKALEIYKLMRTAKEASFVVERDGQLIDVMVSLSGN